MQHKTMLFITLSGVIALAIWVAVLFRVELDRVRRAALDGAVIVKTAAGPIEYAERGEGIPLLSIHGAGGGFDQGLANVEDLVDEGYRVIAPSRFGYLRTPAPPSASPTTQADAHAALLSTLQVRQAVVVGISAGAQSAVELAIRHPERVSALILIVPGTYSPTSPVAVDRSRGSRLVFWLVNVGADFFWWAAEKIAPSILVRFTGVPPELFRRSSQADRDRVMRVVRSIEPLSLRFRGINLDSAPHLHPLPLDKITAPTLIISTRDDLFNTAPAAEFAAHSIPGAKLIIYETGGHLLVRRQDETAAALRDFLDAVNPNRQMDGPASDPDVQVRHHIKD
ncbi:alpha/beta hydrolase [Bradyrhizobium quebecense]|uniref:Alpha/beta hydrolase n=1 Tax=Bradyrhizobium quebecense TaxID=2748629 RepID=A0A973WQ33_9BRAD|nr:alpha/beta hydrolase [Bradyrhizobium quebecense]UGA48436.1 alpha/beta hydrolase [Bradyrhizobium quebecense]